MVKAGQAVDDFIAKLIPLLSKGDIIIDGGNSEHQDTTRRCRELVKKGLLYVGSGVSGGEEGARYGPSLMPGGHSAAWPHIKDIFQVLIHAHRQKWQNFFLIFCDCLDFPSRFLNPLKCKVA